MSLPTPAMQTRDLGSAKEGTKHWWEQRISSIALTPLTLWLIFSLVALDNLEYATVQQWFTAPLNTFLMLAFVITAYYHTALGLRVILEDYVHLPWLKIVSIVVMQLTAFMLALISVTAILKLFL